MFIDPYLANVTIFAGTFAPRGWMFCNGQLLPISQYDALFALIGTTYGGDGQTTFALPDLRSRFAVHTGQGPGLSNYVIGQMSGTESITVSVNQMAVHNHPLISLTGAPGATAAAGTLGDPTGNVAATTTNVNTYNTAASAKMAPSANATTTALAGGGQPITIIPPLLAMNYIIAVEGIFPSRN